MQVEKKYILLLQIAKINDSEKFSKSIEIECIEMNHFENAFTFELNYIEIYLFSKLYLS